VRPEFNGRQDRSEIERHRLKLEQNRRTLLIHLFLEDIHFFVISDHCSAMIVVPRQKPALRIGEIASRQRPMSKMFL
jgi:hypothetical protein